MYVITPFGEHKGFHFEDTGVSCPPGKLITASKSKAQILLYL